MTTLTLRLEEDLVHRLAERVERHGISVEEEAHSVIAEALRKDWGRKPAAFNCDCLAVTSPTVPS